MYPHSLSTVGMVPEFYGVGEMLHGFSWRWEKVPSLNIRGIFFFQRFSEDLNREVAMEI